MKRADLLIILELLRLRKLDQEELNPLYDELLDAYNKTGTRPNYKLPICPDFTYLEVTSER